MTRRRNRNSSGISLKQGILCGMALLVFLGIGAGFVAWSFLQDKFDPVTNCPLENHVPYAKSQLVILVDVTDPLKPDVASRLRTMLENTIKAQKQGTLVELYVLDDRISNYEREFQSCVPKRVEDASEFSDNARMVEANFKSKFQDKVDNAIERLINMDKSYERSPICEMIKEVALKSFSTGQMPIKGGRKMIIVSDFMQHSPGQFSMYNNKKYTFDDFSHTAYGSVLTLNSSDFNIKGVEVKLLYTKTMTVRNANFWKEYFGAGKAFVDEPLPL